jgi:hypothetical protein
MKCIFLNNSGGHNVCTASLITKLPTVLGADTTATYYEVENALLNARCQSDSFQTCPRYQAIIEIVKATNINNEIKVQFPDIKVQIPRA